MNLTYLRRFLFVRFFRTLESLDLIEIKKGKYTYSGIRFKFYQCPIHRKPDGSVVVRREDLYNSVLYFKEIENQITLKVEQHA